MNATNKFKWVNLITKVILLIIFIIIQSRLMNMIETVPDRWFLEWLTGVIFCIAFIIFFAAWIAETVINWNRK